MLRGGCRAFGGCRRQLVTRYSDSDAVRPGQRLQVASQRRAIRGRPAWVDREVRGLGAAVKQDVNLGAAWMAL